MRKFRLGVVVLISILLIAIAGTVYYLLLTQWHTPAYAAGNSNTVKVYRLAQTEAADSEAETEGGSSEPVIEKAGTIVRGSSVSKYEKTVTVDGTTYVKVKADSVTEVGEKAESSESDKAESDKSGKGEKAEAEDAESDEADAKSAEGAAESTTSTNRNADNTELYMKEDNLSDTLDGTILEKEVYVRTPATIYAEETGPAIASFASKGTCLKVIGFDKLKDDGYINKYKVEYSEGKKKTGEGYVYGKYMVGTQKEADAVYNEHGEYDAAKSDSFRMELYGGEAKNLDYFPYERTDIEGNEFCEYARTMYLNGAAAVEPASYVKLIEKTDCNAVVMDLKDGYLAYKSNVAKELSPTSYKKAYASIEDYKKGVDQLRETGVYLIGRIVVFNDSQYAKDHPEDCIKYGGSSGWPSGYSRDVWEYNVRLAQEAVKEFGFNEIQFDYVRFPESTYEMSRSGKADFRNKYREEKAQAIQNFCFYATDQLREVGAYTSVDVFGESAYSYVTAYGQYWMAIANIVDAISAMPYTDHFSGDAPWEDPYGSVLAWAKRAAKQQKRLQNPAAARTWITGYNTPYWAPTVNYNAARLNDQIRALEKAGLKGGFIPWNALSDYDKYNQYKAIWNEK